MKKNFVILVVCLLLSGLAAAQQGSVTWKTSTQHNDGDIYSIIFEAAITPGWHMYDLGPYDGGPNPTVFTFEDAVGMQLEGPVTMITRPKVEYDELFKMEIGYFERTARFEQKVRMTSESGSIRANVEWMICNDMNCMPPTDEDFTISITHKFSNTEPDAARSTDAGSTAAVDNTPDDKQILDPEVEDSILEEDLSAVADNDTRTDTFLEETGSGPTSTSFWAVIIEAILWGFAALLTPCVFPMVPMTVTFFLKSGGNAAMGRFKALMYGIFIIGLYTLPIAAIILITRFAGGPAVTADIFNWLATHWVPNIIFFLVFMIFAASFFGAFEITLPGWMVNKSDSKADKKGLGGIFFMALTLVLVSFSCTGPIVGSVIIKSTSGEFWEPIATMFAFSVAFALPFTLCAFFPSLINKMPKSGGWLNSVKVVLGFIEVALGLKFLSVADQTYHWGILDREIYLAIWIVVFSLMGFYLLGKIKFAHDSEVKHIGVGRLLLVIATFTFVVYLIPGMFGAPLKGLSGYLPPMHTQDFVIGSGSGNSAAGSTTGIKTVDGKEPRFSDLLHLPHGLEGFFDLDEGRAYARQAGKPLFIDFTGHGCVNCREMESRVWSDPCVLDLLRNEFVIVALYSDDKTVLPESEWVTTDNGKVLKSLGRINSHYALTTYGVNAQPYYVIQDQDNNILTTPRGYDLNVEAFVKFLEDGIANYKNRW